MMLCVNSSKQDCINDNATNHNNNDQIMKPMARKEQQESNMVNHTMYGDGKRREQRKVYVGKRERNKKRKLYLCTEEHKETKRDDENTSEVVRRPKRRLCDSNR